MCDIRSFMGVWFYSPVYPNTRFKVSPFFFTFYGREERLPKPPAGLAGVTSGSANTGIIPRLVFMKLNDLIKEAESLQADYLLNKDQTVLGPLYLVLVKLTGQIFNIFYGKYSHVVSQERKDTIKHDVASTFIALYLKRPEYRIDNFLARIHPEIAHNLFGRDVKKHEIGKCQLSGTESEEENEVKDPLEILLDERNGARVVMALYFSKTLKIAAGCVEAINGRDWALANAEPLVKVYKVLKNAE